MQKGGIMIVKSKTTCRCHKCKENIYRGDYKFKGVKPVCWNCGVGSTYSDKWIRSLVKYSKLYDVMGGDHANDNNQC